MKSWRIFSSCMFLTASMAVAQTAPDDPTDPGLPPMPDLTVTEIVAAGDWVRASAGDRQFLPILRRDLDAVGEAAGAGVYLKRLLPGVNYALVQVSNARPVLGGPVDGEPAAAEAGKLTTSRTLIERVRRGIVDLPYVYACLYNPMDNPGPIPWEGIAPDGAIRTNRHEVMPGELIVALNGRPMPILDVHARLGAMPEDWHGLVPVDITVAHGSRADDAMTHHTKVYFHDGLAVAHAVFQVPPGAYEVTVTVDPDDLVAETDETNNALTIAATLPERMLRLQVERVATPMEGPSQVFCGMAVANFSAAALAFEFAGVEVAVDGTPVEPNWPVDGTEPVPANAERGTAPEVGPGQARFWPFNFSADLAEGEHRLTAMIRSLELEDSANFEVKKPVPHVNLYPTRLGANVRSIVIDPRPADPNVRQWLINEVWSSFAGQKVLGNVAVHGYPGTDGDGTDPDAVEGLNAGGPRDVAGVPEKRPDLVLVLDFPYTGEPIDLEKCLAALNEQWMVLEAWEMPHILTDETNSVTDAAGSRDYADPLSMPVYLNQRHIGVILERAIEPQLYTRISTPVVLEYRRIPGPGPEPLPRIGEDRVLSPAPDVTDPVRPMPWFVPHPPVGVDIVGLAPVDDATRADRVTEGRHEQLKLSVPVFNLHDAVAVGYARRNDLIAAYEVTVDPNDEIPEYNEADNTVVLANGPTPEAVFHAHAFIDEEAVDSAGDEQAILYVVGELHNGGETPVEITFNSGLQMDFAWGDFYRWSEGKFFTMAIETVIVEPGQTHRWRLAVPLREIWRQLVRKLPERAVRDGHEGIPPIVLDVWLVGTDHKDHVPVVLPPGHEAPDANGNLIPDFMENDDGLADGPGLWSGPVEGTGANGIIAAIKHDSDLDGWSDILEFIENTDENNPDDAPVGRVFGLRLLAGWNLVSLPVAPELDDVEALLGGLVEGPVYEYVEGEAGMPGQYVKVDKLAPHVAYWMHAAEDVEAQIPGLPHNPGRVVIRRGGADTGAGGPVVLPEDAIRNSLIYRWSARDQAYVEVPDGLLDEGEGYWISSPEDIELDLGE